MERTAIINTIGIGFHKSNIEEGEYSYVKAAGSKKRQSMAQSGTDGRTFPA